MEKRVSISILLVSVIIIISGIMIFTPDEIDNVSKSTEKIEKLSIGTQDQLLTTLIVIANHNGYFEDEGLEMDYYEYDSGRNALVAMLNEQKLDLVSVADAPIMKNSFQRDDYSIVSSIVTSTNNLKVLARVDHGIHSPTDLIGKRVGVTMGSSAQFFLELFLVSNDLKKSDVVFVDINANELPLALKEGKVDAITSWEPNIFNGIKLSPDNTILFTFEKYREDFYIVINNNSKNVSALVKFHKALLSSEEYVKNNPEEVKNILHERMNIEMEYLDEYWDSYEFKVSLDQTVFTALESEARWAINSGYVQGEIPNYLNYVDYEILEKIDPSRVTILK